MASSEVGALAAAALGARAPRNARQSALSCDAMRPAARHLLHRMEEAILHSNFFSFVCLEPPCSLLGVCWAESTTPVAHGVERAREAQARMRTRRIRSVPNLSWTPPAGRRSNVSTTRLNFYRLCLCVTCERRESTPRGPSDVRTLRQGAVHTVGVPTSALKASARIVSHRQEHKAHVTLDRAAQSMNHTCRASLAPR